MKNKILKFILVAPLLMAFQCDIQAPETQIFFNDFKVNISEVSSIAVGDTLWIRGRVSAKVFDEKLGDSIFFEEYNLEDYFSVLRLKDYDAAGNCYDALDQFTVLADPGETDPVAFCPNSELIAVGALSADEAHYNYRIGLVGKETGDFVLSWNVNSIIINQDRNKEILENYPADGNNQALDFNKCGRRSLLLDINEFNREFFFSVE